MDKELPEVSENPEIFSRHSSPFFNFQYANVRQLYNDGTSLFYYGANNLGYLDVGGKANQIPCQGSASHKSFLASFSGEFIVIAHQNMESFTMHPMHNQQEGFELDLGDVLNAKYNNPRIIAPTGEGANFSLNENVLIANIATDTQAKIIIFELDYRRGQNSHPVFHGKVKGMIEVNGLQLGADMYQNDELLISQVKQLKSGWLVTIKPINSNTKGTYFINYDGSTTKLAYSNIVQELAVKNLVEVGNGRFYLIDYNGVISTFSESAGTLSNLVAFAQAPDEVDMQEIDGRLLFFSNTDHIYELVDHMREDFINLEFVKLDTKGLEMTGINAIQDFNKSIYIATKSGLYMKNINQFWKPRIEDSAKQPINTDEMFFKSIVD